MDFTSFSDKFKKVPETIYEYRDFWVFDWKEDCECASMPAVWKESGEIFLFFPPDFQGKNPGNPRKIPLPGPSRRPEDGKCAREQQSPVSALLRADVTGYI